MLPNLWDAMVQVWGMAPSLLRGVGVGLVKTIFRVAYTLFIISAVQMHIQYSEILDIFDIWVGTDSNICISSSVFACQIRGLLDWHFGSLTHSVWGRHTHSQYFVGSKNLATLIYQD